MNTNEPHNEDEGLDAYMEAQLSGENGMYPAGEEDFIDDEPHGSHDLSDDGDALASAGFGTNEDYGDYGGGCGDDY